MSTLLLHRLVSAGVALSVSVFTTGGCAKNDTAGAVGASSGRAADPPKSANIASSRPSGTASAELKSVAAFTGPMPTGVAVSHDGRVFVNFPRWGDDVAFTVAELKDGKTVPYPDLPTNRGTTTDFVDKFVSVQSVVVDPMGRLWVLDTGNLNMGPAVPGAGKLVCFDLASNKPLRTITFPSDVCLPTTYLNDVRFDLRRGNGGFAFITDSSDDGPNGVIVVDLESGKSWRRLHDHPSTKAEPNFVPTVEGQPLKVRQEPGSEQGIKIGSDGIALSADGEQLIYTALAGHHLYSVSAAALADENVKDDAVAATVKDLGDRGFASDGLESDAQGNVYLTDYENNAVRRRDPSGQYTILVQDPRLIWPDTLALASDGYLYVTANQLNRQKQFQEGKDLRQQPYFLFRFKVSGTPVILAPGAPK